LSFAQQVVTRISTSLLHWFDKIKFFLSTNYVNSFVPGFSEVCQMVYNDVEKAEAFNTFFSSQSNIDDTDKSVPADDTPPPRCLDRIVLRQHEVQDVLRLLNTNKASGPDAIHAKLLKVAYDIISKPLCHVFDFGSLVRHRHLR
jgi:hypothetical protein